LVIAREWGTILIEHIHKSCSQFCLYVRFEFCLVLQFVHEVTLKASTYQLRDEEVDSAPHDTGPLGAIQRLQGLSNRTPSQVLVAWRNLNQEEREDVEQPSAQWILSVDKAGDFNDLDIVRRHFISAMAKDLSMIIAFPPTMETCSIHLVDLDIKPTSKLIEHVQKEALCNQLNSTMAS